MFSRPTVLKMDEPDSMAVGQPEPEVEAPDPVDTERYLVAYVT